jgi:hypothetical protein
VSLTPTQFPYTGPYSNAQTRHHSKGPTVIALKRTLARLGYMDWKDEFTDMWPPGQVLDKAYRRWQLIEDMPADGIYGQQAWKLLRTMKVPAGRPNAGQYAIDKFSRDLVQEEWRESRLPDEDDIRAAMRDFCLKAEANEGNWHYLQRRPVDVTIDPSAGYVWSDCSGYVIQTYHWAKTKTGLAIPDPAKGGGAGAWSGYGNTDWYEDDHPHVTDGLYRIGDLAHWYGHVAICRKGGSATTAIFSSHGQEAGPQAVSLHYRSDLRFVVRPPLK